MPSRFVRPLPTFAFACAAFCALAGNGAALAQARQPAPLSDRDAADADTCLFDDMAMAPEIVAACTRLLEGTAITEKVDLAEVLVSRAEALIELKQGDKAMADVEKALQADPEHPEARFIRGGYYIDAKKYDLAIQDFEVTLKADPMDALALFDRGIAKFRMGDKRGADADFAAAKAIEPTIMEDQAQLGIKP